MSEQQEQYRNTAAETVEMIGRVLHLLEALTEQRSIEPLKELFWQELNYTSHNEVLSRHVLTERRIFTEHTASLLADDPLLFASGGEGKDFAIVYLRLASGRLSHSSERLIINQLLNRYPDGLFIFSNQGRESWHFINIKPDVTNPKRRLFRRITVGPEERLRTASERIAMLDLASLQRAARNDIIDRHEDAFDVEAVTKKFYDEYRIAFKSLQIDLAKYGDATWAHDYALQFINRCMFLYFIQRKGWLGGDKGFLKTFWESYRKSEHKNDSFFKDWLQVLFFEAFNNQYRHIHTHFPSSINTILAMAPYLNGGLFSRGKLDMTNYEFTISDMRFSQILGFLERYNFTIAEDSPLDQEVAVDPEMIGRVYENLVNVSEEIDERGEAGIFYTPRTEIDLMCRLALVDYLTNHLGTQHRTAFYDVVFALEPHEQSEADDRLAARGLWEGVDSLLREVTAVDPACGSGAFLVGMLYVLDDLQARADHYMHRPDEDAYARKKRIIGQSLYGVDVMEWAARTAELRLWLALIIDVNIPLEELHARYDPLLPHLTFKVRCGDSLVQEIGGVNFGHRRATSNLSNVMKRRLETLKQEKNKFYNNDATCSFKTREAAEQEEVRLFHEIIRERKHALQQDIQRLRNVEQAAQIALPGDSPAFATASEASARQQQAETVEREKRIAEKGREVRELDEAHEALVSSKNVPFVWDISFVEIFSGVNDGFDIVIGNPPYVRQEQISNPRDRDGGNKRAYKDKLLQAVYQDYPDFFLYNKVTGNAARKLDAKSDLYVYFYLHSLSLLHEKGAFCFITSNSWLDVGYGADLQEFLLRYCRVHLIIDNQVRRSFATADINTVIALFSAPTEKQQAATLDHVARFVMFQVGFESVLDGAVFRAIEQARERTTVEKFYRVYPLAQRALLAEGMRRQSSESEDGEERASKRRGRRGAALVREAQEHYAGDKWGGKYLRAPDIYWTILEKGRGKLVRLGDIADVRRGITTGANEFFYLDEQKAAQWGIEEEFLRPILKSPTECVSILINPQRLKTRIFVCPRSKRELKGTAALKYIEWGESKGFHTNASVLGRAQWWSVQLDTANSIFVKEAHNTSAVFYNPHKYPVDCRLYYANLSTITLLYLNSIIGAMLFELYNRAGLGGGARSLMVSDYTQIPVLDTVGIKAKEETLQQVLQNISPLAPRKLTEDQRKEWLAVDNIVFDALDLPSDKRKEVYEEAKRLVESRLKKASSLKKEKEIGKRMKAVESLMGIWSDLPEDFLDEVHNSYA